MIRYQLRVPKQMTVEDVVGDVTSKAWFMVRHRHNCEELPLRYYRDFQNQIRGVFSHYLKRYSLCGKSDICSDELHKLPWVHQMPDLTGNIRILELEEGLDDIVEELCRRSLRPIQYALDSRSEDDTVSPLRLAFHSALGEYLCLNPWCGKAQICLYSESLNPWKETTPSLWKSTESPTE